MLDRAKRLQMFLRSARRSLDEARSALEELEAGLSQATAYSTIERGLRTIKHDALAVGFERLAALMTDAGAIVERARERHVGLPIELLQELLKEIQAAVDAVAAGGKHRLDDELFERVHAAASVGASVED